jgi:hypothetical protein
MKVEDRAKYRDFLEKAGQHLRAAAVMLDEKHFDAAVSNSCLALINYLDALSVNRFGQSHKSENHAAAPTLLQRKLVGIGIADFKTLHKDCTTLLKLKNIASYEGRRITSKEAKQAVKLVRTVKDYVEDRIDRRVT